VINKDRGWIVETVLTMLLIRFGLIVGGVVLLVLVGFAVALVLRRRGSPEATRERIAPLARDAAGLLVAGAPQSGTPASTEPGSTERGPEDRSPDRRRGAAGELGEELVRVAARYLERRARDGRRG